MTLYDWLKALHVIAVIAWMAGMLYLPRLFVYHAGAKPGSEMSETFKVMERRLLRAIINPAMIAAWILGLSLAWIGDLWSEHWFHAKLFLVILMSTGTSPAGAATSPRTPTGIRRSSIGSSTRSPPCS
jgi:protoporphyrinogen IX oxidase